MADREIKFNFSGNGSGLLSEIKRMSQKLRETEKRAKENSEAYKQAQASAENYLRASKNAKESYQSPRRQAVSETGLQVNSLEGERIVQPSGKSVEKQDSEKYLGRQKQLQNLALKDLENYQSQASDAIKASETALLIQAEQSYSALRNNKAQ